MSFRVAVATGMALFLAGCGGDTVVLPQEPVGVIPDPSAKPTSAPPTTPAGTAGDPLIRVFLSPGAGAGAAPLLVGFDLCSSRDARGGQDLDYLADFDGKGPVLQKGCGFTSRFSSDGVSVFETQLCVQDRQTKKNACQKSHIKAYVPTSVRWSVVDCGADPAVISASATLKLGASSQGVEISGLSAVNRVKFTAVKADSPGIVVASADGVQQKNDTWVVAAWQIAHDKLSAAAGAPKVRVIATISSKDATGDDTPYDEHAGCP